MVRQAPAKRFYIDIRVRFPSVRPARLAQLVEVTGSKSVQSRFESEGEYKGRLTEEDSGTPAKRSELNGLCFEYTVFRQYGECSL